MGFDITEIVNIAIVATIYTLICWFFLKKSGVYY
jgi:hypothetical protein